MIEDDRTYYRRRADQCRTMAERASDSSAKIAQRTMETHYRRLANALAPAGAHA